MTDSSRTKTINQAILKSRSELIEKENAVITDIVITNWYESQIKSTLDISDVLAIVKLIGDINNRIERGETAGAMSYSITGLAHLTSISNLFDYSNPKSKETMEIIYDIVFNSIGADGNPKLVNSIFHSLKAHDVNKHADCRVADTLNSFYLPVLRAGDRKQADLIKTAEELIKFHACPWEPKAYEAVTGGSFPSDIAVLFR